mgnify:CR=1 FL=1
MKNCWSTRRHIKISAQYQSILVSTLNQSPPPRNASNYEHSCSSNAWTYTLLVSFRVFFYSRRHLTPISGFSELFYSSNYFLLARLILSRSTTISSSLEQILFQLCYSGLVEAAFGAGCGRWGRSIACFACREIPFLQRRSACFRSRWAVWSWSYAGRE